MIHDTLSKHPFFSELAPEHLSELEQAARELHFQDGDAVFRQDESARHFYLITKGEASIQIPSIYGPPLIVQKLGAGELLGWSWLIPPYKWHFDARATSDLDVIEFDGARLLQRCEKDPALGYQLLKRFSALMSDRVQAARLKMMEVCEPTQIA